MLFVFLIIAALAVMFGYKRAKDNGIVILYNLSTWNGIITVLNKGDRGVFYNRITTRAIDILKTPSDICVSLKGRFEDIIKESKFENENILFEQRKMFFQNLCSKYIDIKVEFNYKISEDKKILSCMDKARFLKLYDSKGDEKNFLDNYIKLVILYVLNLEETVDKNTFEQKLNVCAKTAFEHYMYELLNLKVINYELEQIKE